VTKVKNDADKDREKMTKQQQDWELRYQENNASHLQTVNELKAELMLERSRSSDLQKCFLDNTAELQKKHDDEVGAYLRLQGELDTEKARNENLIRTIEEKAETEQDEANAALEVQQKLEAEANASFEKEQAEAEEAAQGAKEAEARLEAAKV